MIWQIYKADGSALRDCIVADGPTLQWEGKTSGGSLDSKKK